MLRVVPAVKCPDPAKCAAVSLLVDVDVGQLQGEGLPGGTLFGAEPPHV
jgi:hypothetical protein